MVPASRRLQPDRLKSQAAATKDPSPGGPAPLVSMGLARLSLIGDMTRRPGFFWKAFALFAALAVIGCQADAARSARSASAHQRTYNRAPSKVPAHVQTAVYLWTPQQENADPATFTPYVTWAYPLFRLFGATQRAGMKTVLYVNPLMPIPGNPYEYPSIQTTRSDLQAKDCSGDPTRTYAGKGFLLDVTRPQAAEFVEETVEGYIGRVAEYVHGGGRIPVDLIFVDNANSFYGVGPMPCGFNQDAWTKGMETALGGTSYPVVVNTLGVNLSQVPKKVQAVRGRNIVGAMYEHCFVDRQWLPEETAQIDTVRLLHQLHKAPGPGFWCYVNGGSSTGLTASDATAQRLFQYASFLLTYDPAYSVYQTAYKSPPSTFSVMPETQLVPMDPQIAVQDIESLHTASGAYVQQYQYCYYQRKPIGSCEIVVNPQGGVTGVPNLGGYRHSVVLTGNGVLDGGRVGFDGPLPTNLPPQSAAILVR
jgi:hypothetical protein